MALYLIRILAGQKIPNNDWTCAGFPTDIPTLAPPEELKV